MTLFALLCTLYSNATNLCINEIQVANVDQYNDPSYNYGAWIELYNEGDTEVQLYKYTLRHTDQEGNIEQATLKNSHGSVYAHSFTVLWFDHNSSSGNYGGKAGDQIPFRLDADGGVIELLDANGNLVDAVEYPPCIARCSWMREMDGAAHFGWTTHPTPKASNNTSTIATDRLQAPIVSSTGGVFSDNYSFRVGIPEGCKLYYTTDGSVPSPQKAQTNSDGRFVGNKDAIYRFMLSGEGYLDSPVITCTFLKSDGTHCLPILSVNTAPENFFDNTIGLYVTGTNGRKANNSSGPANQNMDWERPVNVEYFVPDKNAHYQQAINQEATFSIFGGWTRFNPGNENFEYRTSFKLKSDKIYEGENSFAYPIFESKPHIKIKNFLVRNGGQDRNARIWDGAIQELIRTSGVYLDCQAWQPAQVYLNGKYLGMMNLREESNKQFAFSNYGIDQDEIDQWEGDIIIKEGDKKKLDEWYELSKKLASAPTDTAIWNRIAEIVDIDEYCNYMAAETYMGNQDWLRGGFKNLKGFRAKDDNGKFHLVMHDVDGGFGDTNMLQQIQTKGTGSLPLRFKNMLRYEPFRKQFIDAYCLMNGSVFDPDRCEPIITAMKNTINPALEREGLSADEKARLLISRLRDDETRRPALKQSLKTAFSLKNEYTISLKSSTSEARMLLNGQEIPTGQFNGYLFAPITLTSSAPDGFSFEAWYIDGEKASTDSIWQMSREHTAGTYDIEAVYQPIEQCLAPIRINEVSAGNDIFINEYGKKSDWIELYNNTNEDIDLAGIFLSDDPLDAHKFQLAASAEISTIIPAHGYKIIWCDGKESKAELHADLKLKNTDNAFVSVTDINDRWTDSLRYREQPRWTTYGRFPDGGLDLALFERPSIDNPNHLCTRTVIEEQHETGNGIVSPTPDMANRNIKTIRYYTLSGQPISDFPIRGVVIQCIVYDNGTQWTRKTTFGKDI